VRYPIQFMGDVEALRRGQAQLIDVSALPAGPEADALLSSDVRWYTVVPMSAGGELIGALSFGGPLADFPPALIAIAREVAAQFAISLAHVRLHERIKRQAEELEARVRERTAELEAAHAELQEGHAQLTALAAEMESFSYSVSHDLRAPLRAINGFSRILMEKYASQLPEPAREHLQDMRDSAREMGELVDGLLAFSRLGRQAMRPQAVSQDELVGECLADLHRDRIGRRVRVEIGELPPADGDAMLLRQVWLNLISNALKYTSKKEAAEIEIGSRKGDGPEYMITYYVRDNGVGFDMKYAHKLFGVFQRLHRAEEYEGTGVGLAIVQRIVQRHGGRVWAEAQRGEGATFFFTLKEAGLE
jgi:light-regulated signal transduction histidine kinase (bacteriophytochrome)